jgi:hypothetical protein
MITFVFDFILMTMDLGRGNHSQSDLISLMITYIDFIIAIHAAQFHIGYTWRTLCFNQYQFLFESVRSKPSKIHFLKTCNNSYTRPLSITDLEYGVTTKKYGVSVSF